MQLIDGKATAAAIKKEIAEEVERIVASGGKRPHLAAVLVGHDGGSETYVRNKVLACEACGFRSSLIRYEDDVTEEELLACVDKLNRDADVDGFIVQLPLPRHISEQKIIEAIDYRKDVDGFHPVNVGRMAIGLPCFVSATPKGILELLRRYHIETTGRKCFILYFGQRHHFTSQRRIDLRLRSFRSSLCFFLLSLSKRNGTQRSPAASGNIGKGRNENDDRIAQSRSGKGSRTDLGQVADIDAVNDAVKEVDDLGRNHGHCHAKQKRPHLLRPESFVIHRPLRCLIFIFSVVHTVTS